MLLEAKNDFQDCLVRLENFSNNFDRGLQLLNDEENERKHLSLKQRRKRFQMLLMKNPYF